MYAHFILVRGRKKLSRETALGLKELVMILGINAGFSFSTAELPTSLIKPGNNQEANNCT